MTTEEQEDLDSIGEMIASATSKSTTPTPTPKKKSGRPAKSRSNSVVMQVSVTHPQSTFLSTIDSTQREEMRETCFAGGVGSGKSFSLVLALCKYIQHPNTTVILAHLHLSVLRKTTLPLLVKGTISPTGEMIPPLLPPECIKGWNKTNGEILLHNGSNIILVGCKDGEKIRSLNASAAFLDEASLVDRTSYFSLLQRCRVYHPLGNGVYSATNPSHKNHWLWQYFVQNAIPNYRQMIMVDSRTNSKNLSGSYIKSLERLPDEERQRMLEGQWTNIGHGVFDSFDKNTHTQDLSHWNRSDYENYYLGNDLGGGGTTKYSATILVGEKGGIFHCLEEYSQAKTAHSDIFRWMKPYYDLTKLVAFDPANSIFATELENEAYIPVKPDKAIEMGVSKLNSMFKDGRLVISSKCVGMIKELSDAYRNEETDKWDKNGQKCDLVDSLRYTIVAFDDKATIDSLKPKEEYPVFCYSF